MHPQRWNCLTLTLCSLLAGCGVQPVTGGNTGMVHNGSTPLCDVQVTVHQHDGHHWQPLGFGVSDAQGYFELVQNRAAGPLTLTPGEYRCTIESVGPTTWRFPQAYSRPDETPLKVVWADSDRLLDLELPVPVAGR